MWDPHTIIDVSSIEKIQRRAARWVTSDYSWTSSVTSMLNDLQWLNLSDRRKSARLSIFYKSIHHLSTPPIPSHYILTNRQTRYYHDLHYIIPSMRTNAYKYSYFPRTIKEWNSLPITIIESDSLHLFQNCLANLLQQ